MTLTWVDRAGLVLLVVLVAVIAAFAVAGNDNDPPATTDGDSARRAECADEYLRTDLATLAALGDRATFMRLCMNDLP